VRREQTANDRLVRPSRLSHIAVRAVFSSENVEEKPFRLNTAMAQHTTPQCLEEIFRAARFFDVEIFALFELRQCQFFLL